MRGWKSLTLGEVMQLEYGKPLAPEDRNPSGLYPAYGANGEKDRTDRFYRDQPSIIVGRKGSAGEITLTEVKYWPLDVTYFAEFDRQRHDLKFLYYLLTTLDLPSLAKGVKPGINRNEVYAISVMVPPLPEQRRIVAILDEAFEGIAAAKANAEKNLQNARELFDGYLRDVFRAPEPTWLLTVVDQHIRFIDYRGKTPQKTSEGLRLITAKNVKKGFIQEEPLEFVAPESYEGWMTRGIPKRGDVLFTTEAPLGNVAQLDAAERVVFAQRIIIMQPDPATLDSAFLKYLLLSGPMQAKLHAQATGATAQGIKASLLKRIPISFPKTLREQAAIVDRLDSLAEATNHLEELCAAKLAALDELKKVLLSRAFAGVLTTKPAEEKVAEVA